MMHRAIVVLAVLALAGCSKDHSEKVGSTRTTGAGADHQATVDEVRVVLLAERPDQTASINALQITNADGIVTLRGHVDNEDARKALVERVKRMPGVKEVKDELMILPARIKLEPPSRGQPTEPDKP